MKFRIFISLLVVTLLYLSSCTEENEDYFSDDNGYPTIEVDSLKYSYISGKNEYFYDGIFKSKEHIQNFNLKLQENRKYRISSSQEFSDISTINLCLLAGSDTITISQEINGQQVLYFNSSNYQSLILQAQLQGDVNISLDYKLYFEELEYDTLSLDSRQLSYYGHFTDSVADTCKFYPSGSYWYRWLRVNESISNLSDISYSFKLNEPSQEQEFGFVIAGSEELTSNNIYSDNLPNGIFFTVKSNQFSKYKIENSSVVLLERNNLISAVDYNQAIDVSIVTDANFPNKRAVVINGNTVAYIDSGELNYFYIVFSDRAESKISIYNLVYSN